MRSKMPILFIPSTYQNKCSSSVESEYALYFHIPFCTNKCLFCSINTSPYTDIDMDTYTTAILQEFNKHRVFLSSHKINGIHIGGGTPSLLSLDQIRLLLSEIISSVKYGNDIEIVFESHPESLSYKKIDYLSQLPKLTLNVGIQTFHSDQLFLINRPSNRKDLVDKLIYAQKKGFFSLGIDLIAGLPSSSIKSVLEDLKFAIELGINNISLYPLRIEKGSILYKNSHKSFYLTPNDEECIEIMEAAKQLLECAGYSSFSVFHWTNRMSDKTYQYSRHQNRGGEWIGFGAGAYSYLGQTVYLNHPCINDYVNVVKGDNIIPFSIEKLSITSKIIWELSFMFREGYVDREYLKANYGILLKSCYETLISTICDLGYATCNDGRMITLTSKGIVHLDRIENIIEEVVLLKNE